jgi:Family of unknown function (DUF6496)
MPKDNDAIASQKAHEDAAAGKSPSTQAGEFVHEEIDHVREGKHGARSIKQAIAIGLSKARRAGVKLPPPKRGSQLSKARAKATRDLQKGRHPRRGISKTRSRATERALKRESTRTASRSALAQQARSSARRRGAAARKRSALRAVHTKGKRGLHMSAIKAARTRQRHRRTS